MKEMYNGFVFFFTYSVKNFDLLGNFKLISTRVAYICF
jgi:hypothetical protein